MTRFVFRNIVPYFSKEKPPYVSAESDSGGGGSSSRIGCSRGGLKDMSSTRSNGDGRYFPSEKGDESEHHRSETEQNRHLMGSAITLVHGPIIESIHSVS